jgi:hypothetical protein
MNLSHLKEDDPVRVSETDAPQMPEGGFGGYVFSVGRKYLVIKFRRSTLGHEHEIRVRISDGRSPDAYGRYTVLPAGEASRQLARSNDIGMLRAAGLSFTTSGREELMDDELLHKLAEMVEPYVLTTVADANKRQGARHR